MPLSHEDSLRLNVLVAQKVRVIRIDEGKMIVYALTEKGEAKIQLNANQKNYRYIAEVKDFLSTRALGAPGGFPLYIARWNRMGDVRNTNLDKLLLLGEEEAIAAVVNSNDLTEELAESAWWAMQTAENARSMLSKETIANSEIGKQLAQFLIEFLPFEEEPIDMLTSIRLVLQPGLISPEDVLKLWRKAKTKNTLYVGFLDILPDNIPELEAEHADYETVRLQLAELLAADNPYAIKLCKLLSAQGQTFLKAAEAAFKRPPNYDVVAALIESIRRYVFVQHPEAGQKMGDYALGLTLDGKIPTDISEITAVVNDICDQSNQLACTSELMAVQEKLPQLEPQIEAILILSRVTQTILAPTISKSTAVGTLMRKKLKPVLDPILLQLRILQNISI